MNKDDLELGKRGAGAFLTETQKVIHSKVQEVLEPIDLTLAGFIKKHFVTFLVIVLAILVVWAYLDLREKQKGISDELRKWAPLSNAYRANENENWMEVHRQYEGIMARPDEIGEKQRAVLEFWQAWAFLHDGQVACADQSLNNAEDYSKKWPSFSYWIRYARAVFCRQYGNVDDAQNELEQLSKQREFGVQDDMLRINVCLERAVTLIQMEEYAKADIQLKPLQFTANARLAARYELVRSLLLLRKGEKKLRQADTLLQRAAAFAEITQAAADLGRIQSATLSRRRQMLLHKYLWMCHRALGDSRSAKCEEDEADYLTRPGGNVWDVVEIRSLEISEFLQSSPKAAVTRTEHCQSVKKNVESLLKKMDDGATAVSSGASCNERIAGTGNDCALVQENLEYFGMCLDRFLLVQCEPSRAEQDELIKDAKERKKRLEDLQKKRPELKKFVALEKAVEEVWGDIDRIDLRSANG